MSVTFWLTDETADIDGYLRLKMGSRSDAPSMVRSVTDTVDGPTAGVQITRAAAGDALAWLSDPLTGVDLTAAAWEFHVWAKESDAAANASLRFQVYKFTVAGGEAATVLDDASGVELTTLNRSSGRTTGVATATAMALGDRLAVKIRIDDAAASLVDGHTITVSYNGQKPRIEGDSYIICPDDVALAASFPDSTRYKIRQFLMDTSSTNPDLSDQQLDLAWEQALVEYSKDRPYVQIDHISGDGATFDFGLPRRWVIGLSQIVDIEHNMGTQYRSVLEMGDFQIVESALGLQPVRSLRFLTLVPEDGSDNIRLRYSTRHVHTDEEDTIPPDDLNAVACLAASHACLFMAAKAAGASEPTIQADSVQHRDGEQRWRSVSKELRARYIEIIRGVTSDDGVSAASVTRDWDISSMMDVDFMFHRRRTR